MPGQNCPVCLSPVGENDARQECPACHAEYHLECWTENGGCAIYGCTQAAPPEPRQAIEIPVSFWGRENKPCPACGKEILAAAVRCRHCGTTFASARPEEREEFERRTAREKGIPDLKRAVILLATFCFLPCSAPFAAAFGAVWYPKNKEDLASLPTVYGALCKIGLAAAAGQTILITVMVLIYAATRHHF
jgi:hypothetical protein